MPEVRKRGMLAQIGLAADRTKPGASKGEGIVSGFARLAELSRVERPTAQPIQPGVRAFSAAWGLAGTGDAGVLTLTDTENCTEASSDEAVLPIWRGLYAINVTCETSAGSALVIGALWPSGATTGPLFTVAGGTGTTATNSFYLRLDPEGAGLGIVAAATGAGGAWTGSAWAIGYLL